MRRWWPTKTCDRQTNPCMYTVAVLASGQLTFSIYVAVVFGAPCQIFGTFMVKIQVMELSIHGSDLICFQQLHGL